MQVSKYGIFSVLHFPALGPNTERYFVSLRIQSGLWENTEQKIRIWTLFSK